MFATLIAIAKMAFNCPKTLGEKMIYQTETMPPKECFVDLYENILFRTVDRNRCVALHRMQSDGLHTIHVRQHSGTHDDLVVYLVGYDLPNGDKFDFVAETGGEEPQFTQIKVKAKPAQEVWQLLLQGWHINAKEAMSCPVNEYGIMPY
jgi:hypothetical protein